MDIQGIFAVATVSNMEAGIGWYSKLIGRDPDDVPMDTLAQWREGPAGVQLFLDPAKAGTSLITIVVPVMAEARARLAAANLKLGDDVTGDFGIIAQIDDLDGNRITLAEPPKAN